jgi:DNA-binding LacI/PurR family transcriptional regulator
MDTIDCTSDPYDEIVRRIHRGRYAAGQRLPSERALAEEFAVHRTTIQRALTRIASEGLIERRRGCRPVVRTLSSAPTHRGVVALVANAGFPFVDNGSGALLLGAQAVLRARGYRLLFLSTSGQGIQSRQQTEREELEALRQDPVDGVIIVPQDPEGIAPMVRGLVEKGTIVVAADRTITGLDLDNVAADNVAGSVMATEHLLSLGHSRIAFVDSREERYRPNDERRQTFLRTIMGHGLPVTQDSVLDLPSTYDSDIIASFIRDWLKSRTLPTGLVCVHDTLAFHLARALASLNIQIPDDVSIVGYDDDLRHRQIGDVELTTVRQPFFDMGHDAATLLANRLERPDTPLRTIRLAPRLVTRTSTRTRR